ncbi:type I secretion system permease/ATPase [Endozoicomonas gorgoniicola]|uniref:Type I secretion system permease/ATPase n=1 Tax=Endozoicomonas gorgoniicola TaxID=1234144 RepID=A0ABT3MUP2_9GAMM|nr:type I secretion system permease/ATPase [Endozoicomonas gorgoniicola]MCW7553102.1 type I secretion system permease/ATPase [Endozoicomonas gorgoniicola]
MSEDMQQPEIRERKNGQTTFSHSSPLLECLLQLCRHYHINASSSTLVAGLPLENGQLDVPLFIRAAERVGLSARPLKSHLAQLSALVLPAVLLLNNHRACLITDRVGEQYRVLTTESGGSELVDSTVLEQQMTGEVIFVKEKHQYDERTPETLNLPERHWFWGTLLRSRKIYRDVIIASVVVNLFVIVSPLFIMNVYDRVVPNNATDTLWVLAIGAGVAYFLDYLLKTARSHFIDIAGKKSDILLSAQLFEQTLGLQFSARPVSVGSFARHLQEFDYIREFITSSTIATLVDLPFTLLILAVVGLLGGPLVLVPLTGILIIALHSWFIQPGLRSAIENTQRSSTQKHAALVEILSGIEGIKAKSAEGELQYRWEKLTGHIAMWDIRTRSLTTSAATLSSLIIQLVTIGIVVCGVYLIVEQSLSMGGLIAAVMLSGRSLAPIAQLSSLSTRYYQAKSALIALNKVMDLPTEQQNHNSSLKTPDISENILLERVNFQYPKQHGMALNNINLEIKAGEKVAVIGRMGSGKSTFQRLLMRFFTPTGGHIRVDGIDLQQLSPHELRDRIAYVSQDTQLYFGTVRDNITLGTGYVDDEAVLEVAGLCGVTEFTNLHPLGLQMPVAERGSNLSGGQRQSVALARALLSNPSVLLFDEPCSAMDSLAEYQFRERLRELAEDKTLIITTYKSSMLDLVDRIIVFDRGNLIADGPKEKVIEALEQGKVTL